MGRMRDIDHRSVIIGLLCGIILMLGLALGVIWKDQVPSPPPGPGTQTESKEGSAVSTPSAVEVPSHVVQLQLKQQVEQLLEAKVQSLLDAVIGARRSTVRINATLNFRREHTESQTVTPGELRALLSEETSEKSSAESGSEEHAVRSYEVNRTVREIVGPSGFLERLNVALSIDKTRVVINPDTREPEEEDRSDEEIAGLVGLARQAVGLNEQRGDQIAVHRANFDKSDDIHRARNAKRLEREKFWSDVLAYVVGSLALLILLSWLLRRDGFSKLGKFTTMPETRVALSLSVGVFFIAHGLGFWGDSLDWSELGILPGLFFLLVGGFSLFRLRGSEPQV